MRIISGRHKGTKLLLPSDDLIRPTSDRAKEMIFSTLNSILSKKKLIFDDMSKYLINVVALLADPNPDIVFLSLISLYHNKRYGV